MAQGELVDIDTGELRRGRLLVLRGPDAVVFLGFGRRAARLQRFACGGDDDADPFIARCRQIADAVERGELAKTHAVGVPQAVLGIKDTTMRRLAIAEVLAKAGFDPDEPRVPAGNPGGGEWTTGEGEAAVEPTAARGDDVQARKERFVDAHLADAETAAGGLGVPVENILGLSALESGWGRAPFAAEGNNYFGIHYPAPFATGYMLTLDGRTRVATFASYADSLRSFVATAGGIIQGKADPEDFAAALQNSGKFGIDPATGGKVPSYVHDTAATIRGLRALVSRRRV